MSRLASHVFVIGASVTIAVASVGAAANGRHDIVDWHGLHDGRAIAGGDRASYFTKRLPNGSDAHVIVVDMRHGDWELKPAVSEPRTTPTSVQAIAAGASAAVNAGYFNLKGGGDSTSYITLDGKIVADPSKNTVLMGNPKLQPFIARILNRSEVRFMRDAAGKQVIRVTRHTTPLPHGMKLEHAIQAGPQLLPTQQAIDEAFIRTNHDGTDTDSISSLKPAARTAFGVSADGHAIIVCVAGKGQDPESTGITLEELASLMRNLGCVQAINFDGGASTTMYVHFPNGTEAGERAAVCGKNPETLVKSVLLVMPKKQ